MDFIWKNFHDLAEEYLIPFFSGAYLEDAPVKSKNRRALVSFLDQQTIGFKLSRDDNQWVVMRRIQSFLQGGDVRVTEKKVVEAFVDVVRTMPDGVGDWYHQDLRSTFSRRVVVKALCHTKLQEIALLKAVDQLAAWAGQQYEGKPIAASFGFVPGSHPDGMPLASFCKLPFGAVLSNGFDTIISVSIEGNLLTHEQLDHPKIPDEVPAFAPFRMAPLARWSAHGRIAMALNRTGEILIFRDQRLCFTRRGGKWHFLTHEPVIRQIGRLRKGPADPEEKRVRTAVYETCLDASFARTGACIGIVTEEHLNDWPNIADSPADYLSPPTSPKTKTLASMVQGSPFQELDRRLRQELVAIDGATLIDHQGRVLAVGAILNISGGSGAGGRLAAAKRLSGIGVGIKVSQDGGIVGYKGQRDEPKFVVMHS